MYRSGQFYRRELPPLRAVVGSIAGLGLLVVDGYAYLDPAAARPGRPCARRVRHPSDRRSQDRIPHRHSRRTGAAGHLRAPVFVTAAGMRRADAAALVRLMADGSGYPTRCVAPSSPARGRRQLSSGATTRADRRAERGMQRRRSTPGALTPCPLNRCAGVPDAGAELRCEGRDVELCTRGLRTRRHICRLRLGPILARPRPESSVRPHAQRIG